MANVLIQLAPESLKLEIIEIGQLPHYNQDCDDEGKPLSEWTEFRERIKPFDGVLFVTPEYNRSIPGVLKNAVDVGSRPYGKNVWERKPGAVISVSPGAIGGFGANHHLRQTCVFVDIPTMPQPEAYIANAAPLFDDKGNITNEKTREFLIKFMEAFAAWIKKNPAKAL
jgi:chromate reductase, NAD(P)H dehydrogenase (quinone)